MTFLKNKNLQILVIALGMVFVINNIASIVKAETTWVSPTGHSYTYDYLYPNRAYDDNPSTTTQTKIGYTRAWCPFIELLIDEPIFANKVRYDVYMPGYYGQYDQIDIDVYYNNSWHDVYEGAFPQLVDDGWYVNDFPEGTQQVSKARLKLHTKYNGIFCNLVEFDFGQAEDQTPVCNPNDQIIFNPAQPNIDEEITIKVDSSEPYSWVVITVNNENQAGPLTGTKWEWKYTPLAQGTYTVKFYINAENDDPANGIQCLEKSFTITDCPDCTVENQCRDHIEKNCIADDAKDHDISELGNSIDDYWCTYNEHDGCKYVKSGIELVNGQTSPLYWEQDACEEGPGTSILYGEKKVYVNDINKYTIKARLSIDDNSWFWINGQEVEEFHRECCGWTDWKDVTNYFNTEWNELKFKAEDTCGNRHFNMDWEILEKETPPPPPPPEHCSEMNYPFDRWQRVWYECENSICDSHNLCLGNGPDENSLEFNNDWVNQEIAYEKSDWIQFKSSRTIHIDETGTYRFSIGSDDGVRLFIDDELLISEWIPRSYTVNSFDIDLQQGDHIFKLDYYEIGGDARVSFEFEKVEDEPPPPPPPPDPDPECSEMNYPSDKWQRVWYEYKQGDSDGGDDYTQGQTPDAYIELPLGGGGELAFDQHDNLIVQDVTWGKIWVINLDQDPSWLKPADKPANPYESVDFNSKNVLKMFGQRNYKEAGMDTIVDYKVSHTSGIVVDKSAAPNRVYIADSGNNRILGFNNLGYCSNNSIIECTNNSDCGGADCNIISDQNHADLIFGQPDGTSGACNGDNNVGVFKNPTKNTLCLIDYPERMNIGEYAMRINFETDKQGNLYVPDIYNNRILRYNQPFSSDKSEAIVPDFVWGQNDFTSREINHGLGKNNRDAESIFTSSHDSLSTRGGVSVDPDGNLWVADTYNGRVLRFPPDSKQADLVIGQKDFTSYENIACAKPKNQYTNQYFDRLCQPGLARVHPETGSLYVMDITNAQNESGHSDWDAGRILIFHPPFYNGMPAERSISPNTPTQLKNTDWKYVFMPTGFTFNTFKDNQHPEYAQGTLWVTEMGHVKRVLLIDDWGNPIKVINAPSFDVKGCDGEYYVNECGITDAEYSLNLCDPWGSVAFDNDNNIYVIEKSAQRIVIHTLPYELDEKGCIPAANNGLFTGRTSNAVTGLGFATPFGLIVFNDQLVARDRYRFLVWNDYLKMNTPEKPTGSSADFAVGQESMYVRENSPIGGFGVHTIDDKNRVWTNNNGRVTVYQLPFTRQTMPLADRVNLYWADDPDGEPIDYWGYGTAFDEFNKKVWMVDRKNHRILRIKNYNDLSGKLYIDMVIGQPNKDETCCNQVRKSDGTCGNHWEANKYPRADTICYPTRLNMDNYGNLYVTENDSECHGNARITVFMAEDLKNENNALFPKIFAKKVFVRKSLTEPNSCAPLENEPYSPVNIAFNSRNQMVVGNDGYYPNNQRHLKQLWFYNNPLEGGSTPNIDECLGNIPDKDETNLTFENDWSLGTIAYNLSNDIRFESSRTIHINENGVYRFTIKSDDGVKLWIDKQDNPVAVIDDWTSGPSRINSADIELTAGDHKVQLDYFEDESTAYLKFDFEKIDLSVDLRAALGSSAWQDSLSNILPSDRINLSATVSGTAIGTINYKFDCSIHDGDCTEDEDYSDCEAVYDNIDISSIPNSWTEIIDKNNNAFDVKRIGNNEFAVRNICGYSSDGDYTAKVMVQRDSAPTAVDLLSISVQSRPLDCNSSGHTDDFSKSELSNNWNWYTPSGNPDYSLSEHSGCFMLYVSDNQSYDHWGLTDNAPQLQRTDINNGDWAIETHIYLSEYIDNTNFHTGLMVYFDKYDILYWGPYRTTNLRVERSGHENLFNINYDDQEIYLRIRKQANTYYFDYSDNGDNWINAGSYELDKTPQNTGLITKTWENIRVATAFDYFEFEIIVTPPKVSTININPNDIQTNQAVLKGELTDLGGSDEVYVWFVWDVEPHSNGDDYANNNKKDLIKLADRGLFDKTITGLSPDTVYHFRAAANNTAGTTYGAPNISLDINSHSLESILIGSIKNLIQIFYGPL